MTADGPGVQVGTVDALLAQLCIHHDLMMLTADNDFRSVAGQSALKVWNEAKLRSLERIFASPPRDHAPPL